MPTWSSAPTSPSSPTHSPSCRRWCDSPKPAAMTFEVAVLLSIGRHPASGRLRRADLDSRGLELALRLVEDSARAGSQIRVHAVHAGTPGQPAIRGYLGMGVEQLTVLDIAASAD